MLFIGGGALVLRAASPNLTRGPLSHRSLGVPLAQLQLIGTGKVTAQAIADWHYWVPHENEF
ncbi:MAG TPA: calcium-binding protein [Steroidobacteraceae bacterium]|nr:calcium-binding protein [Steroidobacteraceae bacterium]